MKDCVSMFSHDWTSALPTFSLQNKAISLHSDGTIFSEKGFTIVFPNTTSKHR